MYRTNTVAPYIGCIKTYTDVSSIFNTYNMIRS